MAGAWRVCLWSSVIGASIQSRVKPMPLKLVFTACLLDGALKVQNGKQTGKSDGMLRRMEKSLSGFFCLSLVQGWATFFSPGAKIG